jgi:hypothetical protein
MGSSSLSEDRVRQLTDRLLPEVAGGCPALAPIRHTVWMADEHLDPRDRDGQVDGTVSPRLAYLKDRRQAAMDILAAVIGEAITSDTAVLPWELRFAVVASIGERLVSHD